MADDQIKLNKTQTLRIIGSTSEALELESTWEPGGRKPPMHWHPRQYEHFEVLEGELTAQIGDESARVFRVGDQIDVPPKISHSMWNAGAQTARASWRVTPALRTESMFRYIDKGRSPIRDAWMLLRFRREFRLGKR